MPGLPGTPGASVGLFGVDVPAHRGDTAGEYDALVNGAALLPAPWERLCVVEGRERVGFLQAMLTQDVAGLAPGECRPAALADRKGHLVADLWIRRDGDRLLLRVRTDRVAPLFGVLDRHRISEDVRWTVAQPMEGFLLLGPGAPAALASFDPAPLPSGGYRSTDAVTTSTVRMLIRETGPEEWVLFVPAGAAEAVASALLGPPARVRLIGWNAFNYRRIERVSSWFGLDGDESRLVAEMLPDDRISYTKGCFLGQESLGRLHYQGQLNWRVTVIRLPCGDPPAPGTDLLDREGARVGWTASAASLPGKDSVAIAYLHRRFRESPGPLQLPSGLSVSWSDRCDRSPLESA